MDIFGKSQLALLNFKSKNLANQNHVSPLPYTLYQDPAG